MGTKTEIEPLLQNSIMRLLDYCIKNDWSGFDPYDGLNSRLFCAVPFIQNRMTRLIFIQAMKRSPLNLRHIFFVPKGDNPKGLAVFCSALFTLFDAGINRNDDTIPRLLNRLIDLKSPNSSYYCWGYNFDWQNRYFVLPKFVPNIICTTFAGNALIDAYKKFADRKYLDIAISAGNFLLKGLNVTKYNDEICFSYTPLEQGQVHNANLLGAAFLSRLYSITHEEKFIAPAFSAVRFSTRRQNEDGSWAYGEGKTQRWIDNFHTGYNLVALKKFSEYTGNADYTENLRRGFRFYKENLFTDDGLPKYYHDKIYPIDIHAIAQSIITFVEFQAYHEDNGNYAKRIITWSLKNMQSDNGNFFYQKNIFVKNKIPYMRWSQAWMLLALATYLHSQRAISEQPAKG